MIQWYFDFEESLFQENESENMREGERKYIADHNNIINNVRAQADNYALLSATINGFAPARDAAPANSTTKRKRHVEMGLGMARAGKKHMPYPKQYLIHPVRGEHYADCMHVCAKCIN